MADARDYYIDIEDGLSRVRGNKGLYKRMLGMFVQSAEFAAFEEAWAERNYEKMADIAHSLKGMTGNLGLVKVYELSSKMMVEFRSGNKNDALVAEYQQALEKTKQYVDELLPELG